jgi:hypothetical protein
MLLAVLAIGAPPAAADALDCYDHFMMGEVDPYEVRLLPRPARIGVMPVHRRTFEVRRFAADGSGDELVTVIDTERNLLPARPVIPPRDPEQEEREAVYSLFKDPVTREERDLPHETPTIGELVNFRRSLPEATVSPRPRSR